jgi:hypothetical protein
MHAVARFDHDFEQVPLVARSDGHVARADGATPPQAPAGNCYYALLARAMT